MPVARPRAARRARRRGARILGRHAQPGDLPVNRFGTRQRPSLHVFNRLLLAFDLVVSPPFAAFWPRHVDCLSFAADCAAGLVADCPRAGLADRPRGHPLVLPPRRNTSSAARIPASTVNGGIQIAQRGGLVIRDPVVASGAGRLHGRCSSPFLTGARDTVYVLLHLALHGVLRHRSRCLGTVIGQFPHLFPGSIAIA